MRPGNRLRSVSQIAGSVQDPILAALDPDLDLAESAVEGVGIDRHDRYEGIVRLQGLFEEIFQGLPSRPGWSWRQEAACRLGQVIRINC